MMKRFPLPEVIKKFNSVFEENGYELYVVGGAVRDYLLSLENHDYDFCTNALPQEVISIFKNTIPTGLKHGTVTVLFKGQSFEVTTYRTESDYTDSRHPDNVKFVRNLKEDLSRRDFTVNAFAANCRNGKIVDLYHGKRDLRKKIIRAIGKPEERFNEDALRIMRLARFSSKLGFTPDSNTLTAAKKLSYKVTNVSQERICEELFKTLMTSKPSIGINIMDETGILELILPELSVCKSYPQNKKVCKNVYEHILLSVDAAARFNYSLTVRFACLLHDIAKPRTFQKDEYGKIHYHNHDIESAKSAVSIAKRLKCSNQITEEIRTLIECHMIAYKHEWTDGAVKRFINKVGKERINPLFELQWCDQIATDGISKVNEYDEFIERIKICQEEPLSVTDLKINGNDLAKLGIPKSKIMGEILNKLLSIVLDNKELNNYSYLSEKSLMIFNEITNAQD